MTPPKGICKHCGDPVTAGQTAAYAVQGYEYERAQGGQNHVVGKERVDGYIWHDYCLRVVLLRRAGTGEQQALV